MTARLPMTSEGNTVARRVGKASRVASRRGTPIVSGRCGAGNPMIRSAFRSVVADKRPRGRDGDCRAALAGLAFVRGARFVLRRRCWRRFPR